MFIEKVKNNGKDYLRLVRSIRRPNKNGDMVSKKDIVLNIGPLDRFDDGKPDYYERLKESFRNGDPLIPALKPYCDKTGPSVTYRILLDKGNDRCLGETKTVAPVLMEKIMEEFGLHYFFNSCKRTAKSDLDLYNFAKLLIFGRLLKPADELTAVQQNNMYFEPVLKDYKPDDIYSVLDLIYNIKNKLARRLNTNLVQKPGRTLDVIYYNITNFNCKIAGPERKTVSVHVGLFMDDNGIPIAIESLSGNVLDHINLFCALKNSIEDMEHSRFILIENRDIYDYPDLLHIRDDGDGYIVCKDLLNCTDEEKDWACDDDGYKSSDENFRYKSRILKKTVTDENGNCREIEEKVVVYQNVNIRKGSGRNNSDCCQIVTSELEMDAAEVISKYINMTQMEEQFRMLKNTPHSQPACVYKAEHLEAQLVICAVSLVILRIIQQRIIAAKEIKLSPDSYLSTCLNGEKIRDALLNWQVYAAPEGLFMFMNKKNPDLEAILEAFDINIQKQLYQIGELKHIKTEVKIF